ncbi:MAG TPA: dienelactone hydrolase family protein [Casimicrobiaceae bacterium]|nr:dienelactone hydrolase family protein [Casimicrobiaceae bacterium]
MAREVADRVERAITIPAGDASLDGDLTIPAGAKGIVLFAHGSGSSRSSPRNVWVAERLQQSGLATLLFDLLTSSEDARDTYTRQHRFDIGLLAKRLALATRWVDAQPELASLPLGYFGASTGAAAALVAASELGNRVGAVVSRGGRPDLAGDALAKVKAPTLLVVGGADDVVLDLNRRALALLGSEKRIEIVPGATHLFEEPGALERVADLAAEWLVEFLIVESAR